MVWQPYLSILISIEGITEQRRLHLNRFAPVISALNIAEASAESCPWGMAFSIPHRCVCLEGSSRHNNTAVDLCVGAFVFEGSLFWSSIISCHILIDPIGHWGRAKRLRMLFYRRVNKRAAIYCQFMPWQVVMEAVRSRLAWAAAAAAAAAMEE